MTAGLSWDESLPYTDPRNDHVAMNNAGDPIRYVLERPLATKPGTRFLYSSGISIALGDVIHKASGLRTDEFAEAAASLHNLVGITLPVVIANPQRPSFVRGVKSAFLDLPIFTRGPSDRSF
jgi:hypothetical protein